MPHVSSSGGGDDLGSEDEVKVFKDEGEEEKRSSENLTEDKSDLIDLTESEVRETHQLSLFPRPPLPRKTLPAGKCEYSSDLVRLWCVAGKRIARRRQLRSDGESVDQVRPQSSFR